MILLHRSPKDTLVSTYYFAKKGQAAYQGDFEEFMQYFMSGESLYFIYLVCCFVAVSVLFLFVFVCFVYV